MLVQLYNIVYRNKLQIKCTAHFYCLEKQRNNENIFIKYYSFAMQIWEIAWTLHIHVVTQFFGIVKILCLYIFPSAFTLEIQRPNPELQSAITQVGNLHYMTDSKDKKRGGDVDKKISHTFDFHWGKSSWVRSGAVWIWEVCEVGWFWESFGELVCPWLRMCEVGEAMRDWPRLGTVGRVRKLYGRTGCGETRKCLVWIS